MYEIKRIRKKGQEALQGFCLQDLEEGSMVGQGLWQNYRKTDEGVPLEFLTFPLLEETGIVKHLFSTRLGGVSQGDCASMNFSMDRGDSRENVLTNFGRIDRKSVV